MSVFLEDHPPKHKQYRDRHETPTGAIVIHSSESAADLVLPDDGSLGVARWIANRSDTYGSYHTVVDSDGYTRVGKYEWCMYGEGTGGNDHALHVSIACKAGDWEKYPQSWIDGALAQLVAEAVRMAQWCQQKGYPVPRAARITKSQYHAGQSGFITHGELDAGRRSDPGDYFRTKLFKTFIRMYASAMGFAGEYGHTAMPTETDVVLPASRRETIKGIQQVLKDAGFYSGPLDGDPFTATLNAVHGIKNDRNAQIAALADANYSLGMAELEIQKSSARIGQLEADLTALKEEMTRMTAPDPTADVPAVPESPVQGSPEAPYDQDAYPADPEGGGSVRGSVLSALARMDVQASRVESVAFDLRSWSVAMRGEIDAIRRIVESA